MNILSVTPVQSTTQTNIVAENTTLTYGGTVLLNISAGSVNYLYISLSPVRPVIYTAYIYGGDLPAGLSIQLYPSESETPFLLIAQ